MLERERQRTAEAHQELAAERKLYDARIQELINENRAERQQSATERQQSATERQQSAAERQQFVATQQTMLDTMSEMSAAIAELRRQNRSRP